LLPPLYLFEDSNNLMGKEDKWF